MEDIGSSSESETSGKKIVCTEKIYKIDHAEICLWISTVSFIINVNKKGKFLCFRKKVTSQVIIKKMFLGGGR